MVIVDEPAGQVVIAAPVRAPIPIGTLWQALMDVPTRRPIGNATTGFGRRVS